MFWTSPRRAPQDARFGSDVWHFVGFGDEAVAIEPRGDGFCTWYEVSGQALSAVHGLRGNCAELDDAGAEIRTIERRPLTDDERRVLGEMLDGLKTVDQNWMAVGFVIAPATHGD